jgi:DNA-binding PadR family transcriptional regulator
MDRELLLLGLLRLHDMHGYQLHEFINRNLAACTDLKKPTAYHLLDRMAAQGWLSVSDAESTEGNRPNRRVYHLTADGEAAYQRLLRENLAVYQPATFTGSIGLAFLDSLPRAEALTLLTQRRDGIAEALAVMQAAPEHGGSMNLVIEHQIHHLQSELDWLESVLYRLGKPEEQT